LARGAIGFGFGLILLWIALDVYLWFTLPNRGEYNFAFDGLGVAFLLALTAVAARLVGHGRVLQAGYLIALEVFILASVVLVAYPGEFPLVSLAYLLPILAAGAIVGGPAAYPFALGGLAMVVWTMLRVGPEVVTPAIVLGEPSAIIYVVVHGLVFFGTALLLHGLSNHIQHTVGVLRTQADRLAELAHTDSLTGLANRRSIIEKLEREFTRARRYQRPLSLLYLDLDGFKAINDRFGHMFGDEILRGVAVSLLAVLRSTDHLARIGGDEFAVLLPETTLEASVNVAEKLRRALASYSQQLGPTVPPLNFCAGASSLLESDTSVDDMLARADQAQYLAKDTGKAHTRTQRELPELAAVS
jgi:diguanylate cyclase (GGDEF)-like protein